MKFNILKDADLKAFQDKLTDFEKQFIYPFDKDRKFYISHGKDYNAFFKAMGEPRYLVGQDENKIRALIALVRKDIAVQHKIKKALYLGDLKIDRSFQGKGLLLTLIQKLFFNLSIWRLWRGARLIFFISMVGEKGSVFRVLHTYFWLRRTIKKQGTFLVYMTSIHDLQNLTLPDNCKEESKILNLSPGSPGGNIIDVQGLKDICFEKGTPLNFAHVNIAALTGKAVLERLKDAAHEAEGRYEILCFALDERRQTLIDFLKKQNIQTNSKAEMGIFLLGNSFKHCILSLNTNDI